ncbi:MAG TPA: prolyl oligopeptidase family serine peptidase [Candidatus Baltobacteraceae bacterium]|nr:prolyl oligopeptidase family serine peptidase [Candidatus Baltobacteraceae bacterium]
MLHVVIMAFSMAQVLSYPFPTTLVRSADGHAIAYAVNQRGDRSIWVARAPRFVPREVVALHDDDGRTISWVQLSRDGARVVYQYGSTQNPSLSVTEPQIQIWSADVDGGASRMLGVGSAPALSPDGSRVAFEHEGEVWIAPVDGTSPAKRLFYDSGKDWDLQWSPSGDALAFVSARGDHSFIGVYRGADRPLEFFAPSVANDLEPRWSPDGASIVFARTPGAGGAPQSPLRMPVVPWSIWIARVSDGTARPIWRSPDTSRGSFPTQGGDVDLTWLGNARVAFLCEADNWPHIYVVNANGGAARRLTAGEFAVVSMTASDDGRSLIYVANTGSVPNDIDRWHLFRVDAQSGGVMQLTAGYSSQWWPMPLAGDALAYVTATAQRPPLVALASANGTGERLIDAALMPADFPTQQLAVPSEVTYHAPDGTLIHAQLFAPRGTARGPAIVFVHGGPMRQMLLTWNPMDYYDNSYAVDQYLVSRGFAVLSVNYRSSVDYGHDFHYAVRTGWAGASEYQDVLAGARWLQHQPSVDPARIGIWGGSWGGYLTALALARNSDVFKAGVDYSGVHDLMHDALDYFRSYGEGAERVDLKPWLHLAWNSSPVGSIAKWRSPVLLIQGDQDPDVAFHQLVDLVPRLQQQHVRYRLIVLPDEAHTFLRWSSWLRTDQAAAAFFQRYIGDATR